MEQIQQVYGLPKETAIAIIMLYRNTKPKVRSLDRNTDFHVIAGILQEDTLTPYLFIICQDYVLRTSRDLIKENGFTLKICKKQTITHHHLAVTSARISLTLSRHLSLLFIAFGRSSGLHLVSSHSCCMYVRAGRPAFARPCEGVYRSTSLVSSSQLLQQCPACLVRLIWIVFEMGGWWSYSRCFVGCCLQDLFNIARIILV